MEKWGRQDHGRRDKGTEGGTLNIERATSPPSFEKTDGARSFINWRFAFRVG
jgi:hypothetical protein